jgi:hypothetical protein
MGRNYEIRLVERLELVVRLCIGCLVIGDLYRKIWGCEVSRFVEIGNIVLLVVWYGGICIEFIDDLVSELGNDERQNNANGNQGQPCPIGSGKKLAAAN